MLTASGDLLTRTGFSVTQAIVQPRFRAGMTPRFLDFPGNSTALRDKRHQFGGREGKKNDLDRWKWIRRRESKVSSVTALNFDRTLLYLSAPQLAGE